MLRFVVAGCGIGGLTVAHALSRLGHQVDLFERASELRPVGAGISIQPNAMQAFRQLDIHQSILEASWTADVAQVLFADGRVVHRMDFSDYESEYGFLPSTIYRGDLIHVLHQTLPSTVTTHLSEGVDSFEELDDSVRVNTSQQSMECDALIGADGIHSAVRSQLWGKSEPNYAGYVCWRGMVSVPQLVEQVQTLTEVWGPGSRFGFMRCNPNQVYWFGTLDSNEPDQLANDPDWGKHFDGWIAPIPELIRATDPNEIVYNPIVDRDLIDPWGVGRVTLLGDAAHAMTPNFGQGGAQAIEDAVILGKCFEKMDASQNNESISSTFRSYEAMRHPRTSKMVKGSRGFGKIGQGGSFLRRQIRNRIMPRLPKWFLKKAFNEHFDFDGIVRDLFA